MSLGGEGELWWIVGLSLGVKNAGAMKQQTNFLDKRRKSDYGVIGLRRDIGVESRVESRES